MQIIEEIRDYIDSPRVQSDLIKDSYKWAKLTNILDIIGDTEYAIQSYIERNESDTTRLEIEKCLLQVYGLLQAIFIQQDAIKHLSEIHNIPMNSEALKKIREIRNKFAGHPTDYKRKGKSPFHRIIPESNKIMRLWSFQDGDNLYETINVIEDIILPQEEEIKRILRIIHNKLLQKEKVHKLEFCDVKLDKNFPDILLYGARKLRFWQKDTYMASSDLENIKNAIDEFSQELSRRKWNVEVLDEIKCNVKEIEELINIMKAVIDGDVTYPQSVINAISDRMEKLLVILKTIANEIDTDYQS